MKKTKKIPVLAYCEKNRKVPRYETRSARLLPWEDTLDSQVI
jgi:hypothetical protein